MAAVWARILKNSPTALIKPEMLSFRSQKEKQVMSYAGP
jgi:hypothetical protein